MSRYLIITLLLFIVSSIFADDPICVEDSSVFNDIHIVYLAPDLTGTRVEIIQRTGNGVDTVRFPISSLIRLTNLNKQGMQSIRQYYGEMSSKLNAEVFPRRIPIGKMVAHREYLISLTIGIRTHSDLLLWRGRNDGLCLVAVYPSVIGRALYGYPDFLSQSGDTLVVGYEREEEGSINGEYYQLLIRDDAITGLKRTIVKGHGPFVGNPLPGATCRKVTILEPEAEGFDQIQSIHYVARDENGEPILCSAKGDSLRLYHLTSVYEKPGFKGKVPARQHMPVGERTLFHLPPRVFLAVEYAGEWYWIPEEDVYIE